MRLLAATVLAFAVSSVSSASLPFGISFDDGKLGVNFFGFNAAVGGGGRSNGDGSRGGLHVEAGTPFGQRAVAGLGGNVDGKSSGGGLYAGATAGGNVAASAGLNGDLFEGGGSRGSLYSRASAGPVAVSKGLDSNPLQSNPIDYGSEPEDHDIQNVVSKRTKTKKTKVVEKEVERNSNENGGYSIQKNVNIGTRFSNRPGKEIRLRKHSRRTSGDADRGIGYGTSYMNAFLSPNYNSNRQQQGHQEEDEDRSYSTSVQKEVVYSKQHRAGFFDDIFNIPISTLGAVSRFLSNSANAGGSVDVRKTVSYQH